MEYKDVSPEQIYRLMGSDIHVFVIGKNAGWVNVKFDGGDTKRIRASELIPLLTDMTGQEFDRNVHVTNTDELNDGGVREKIISTTKRIYKKPPGERMKINGFKYRIRHLDDNDTITNRCMFRRKGYTTLKFTPCVNVVGLIAANCPKFEFIEILSVYYKPPA